MLSKVVVHHPVKQLIAERKITEGQLSNLLSRIRSMNSLDQLDKLQRIYFDVDGCNNFLTVKLQCMITIIVFDTKNIGTNDKFCEKVALLRYTERLKILDLKAGKQL